MTSFGASPNLGSQRRWSSSAQKHSSPGRAGNLFYTSRFTRVITSKHARLLWYGHFHASTLYLSPLGIPSRDTFQNHSPWLRSTMYFSMKSQLRSPALKNSGRPESS